MSTYYTCKLNKQASGRERAPQKITKRLNLIEVSNLVFYAQSTSTDSYISVN